MAEKAHYHLESTLPSLQLFSSRGLFDSIELSLITKQRTTHEYAMAKRIPQKIDYITAIDYETKLGMLVEERIKRLKLKDGGGLIKAQGNHSHLCSGTALHV
jgi:U3 small nucleolar RNA-associated protein 6